MAKPKLNLSSFTGVVATASGTKTAPDAEILLALIDVEHQVRSELGDLTDLTASIKDIGILEPILLLSKDNGRYRLIAGERRYRSSLLAGLTKIPALIRRDLTEFQIRQIQVTENNDREDLSAYDEAMGVASDVESFGFKEAQKIWNRSESWVSKRLSVKKYADPVRELLKDKLCGDLELLLSLNQLLELSADEFGHMVRRMKDGLPVSRDEVRNKVSTVKAWNIGQADLATRRAALQKNQQSTQAKQGKNVGSKPSTPSAKDVAAGERRRQEEFLEFLHQEVFKRGDYNQVLFNNIKSKLDELGRDMNESEWVLWHGFLATVLPMMHALGNERSLSYFKRLQIEIKTKTPVQAPQEIPAMPEGWRF